MKKGAIFVLVLSLLGVGVVVYSNTVDHDNDDEHKVEKNEKSCCGTCSPKKVEKKSCSPKKEEKKSCCSSKKVVKSCGTKAKVCSKTGKVLPAKAHLKTISTAKLAKLIKSKAKFVLLDARSAKYDDGHRIPGALSLTSKATPAQVEKVLKSKKTKIVTYCSHTKCPASARLAKYLVKLGYKNVIEYPKGIKGWRSAGLSTIKVRK